jgi:hypothetical protein
MTSISYTFRSSLAHTTHTYTLDGSRLDISGGQPISFADIQQVRTYDAPGLHLLGGASVLPTSRRCVIRLKQGHSIVLSTHHFIAVGTSEDRSWSYDPFVAALIRGVAAANSDTLFVAGMPLALWLLWLFVILLAVLLMPLLLLGIIGGLADGVSTSAGIIYASLLLFSVVIAIRPLARTLKKDRPRRYDPRKY